MINRFVLNEVSYFGPGAREVLPQEIKRLGLHKAFVATDKDLIKFGVADKVLKVLENAGIPYERVFVIDYQRYKKISVQK